MEENTRRGSPDGPQTNHQEKNVRKSRFVVTLGLVLAIYVAALAFADGAAQNQAFVDVSLKPRKLDRKKYEPTALFTDVRTTGPVPGIGYESDRIEYDRDGKWDYNAAPTCSARIDYLTTEAAKAACPKGSEIGSGDADVLLPGGPEYTGLAVTIFHGPGKNEFRYHTFDPRLAGATPTTLGKLKTDKGGGKYGPVAEVADVPDPAGDVGMITRVAVSFSRKSGMFLARCEDKRFLIRRIVTYDEVSKEIVTHSLI